MKNEPTRIHTGAVENLTQRFAHRAAHMKPSEIRSLFAVASRPEIVSLGWWHAKSFCTANGDDGNSC
jgi:hypothetical protein